MTLAELNAQRRAEFVQALGWIFEASPWVAERAWQRRPFATLDALHAAMTDVVMDATDEERLTLLRNHPDLGTRARISDASMDEQRGAGLDRLTADEFVRFERLNDDYRARFGFPFLFAVKGSTKHDVLAALESRGAAPQADEFAEAIRQVCRIARFRLEELLGEECRGDTR